MRRSGLLLVLFLTSFHSTFSPPNRAAEPVDFERDVLPILRRACWECHGNAKQEGGLRLDERSLAFRGGDSGEVISPGKPDASELLRRVSLPRNDVEVMPSRGDPLTPRQIAILRTWIEQGAAWPANVALDRHWAYEPPQSPRLPEVADRSWPQTPIDYFVLARLEAEGLNPAPRAPRETLLRRVYLDLIGLPPSPADVDAFLGDDDPLAYARVVDRLLGSDQFGVRWARPWLDYARYADSHGFQRDDFRDLWAYRDWVIDAFNADRPYDQFSLEQLAGDLIPNATESQRIATGFHRSAPTNVEAGSDPEETRVNQVFDRVNTLGMIWLGTTLECSQCHDHKYDPFTMKDYYGLFACFNQTALEADRANPKVPGSIRFLGPEMPLQDLAVEADRAELEQQLEVIRKNIAAAEQQAGEFDEKWERELTARVQDAPREEVLPVADFHSLEGADHETLPDHSVLLHGEAADRDTYTVVVRTKLTGIRAFKLEALTDDSLPGKGPGRGDATRPNFVLNHFQLEAAPQDAPHQKSKVQFSTAKADYSNARYPVADAIDDDPQTGWAIHAQFHQPHWAVFEAAEPIGFPAGTELTFQLVQNHGGGRTMGRLRLTAMTGNAKGTAIPGNVTAALAVAPAERTTKQRQELTAYRLSQSPEHQRLQKQQQRFEAQLRQLKPPTTLVMQELEEPRQNVRFQRGDFRSPGEPVQPAVPAVLRRSEVEITNRLDLARWLFDGTNPLVSRVAVNRWWSEIFGHGIVTTPEDFGLKGEPPTHPELLDWLAVEYQRQGWSLKQLLRSIVLSATYQQSAGGTADLLARDDQNLLYARGPRLRLDAEAIRDQALAAAGLLSLRQGGAPIRPYQPDGLWVKVGGQKYDYQVSPGDEQHRRGVFVVLKRAAPYPSFVNFDANSRMACRVRRPRSNTPLQALTLLNDPVFVEAAVALAKRVLAELPDAGDETRIEHAHRLVLARAPRQVEREVLLQLLEQQRQAGKESPSAAAFCKRWPHPDKTAPAEFVAWYAVSAALLNLDEAITKP